MCHGRSTRRHPTSPKRCQWYVRFSLPSYESQNALPYLAVAGVGVRRSRRGGGGGGVVKRRKAPPSETRRRIIKGRARCTDVSRQPPLAVRTSRGSDLVGGAAILLRASIRASVRFSETRHHSTTATGLRRTARRTPRPTRAERSDARYSRGGLRAAVTRRLYGGYTAARSQGGLRAAPRLHNNRRSNERPPFKLEGADPRAILRARRQTTLARCVGSSTTPRPSNRHVTAV